MPRGHRRNTDMIISEGGRGSGHSFLSSINAVNELSRIQHQRAIADQVRVQQFATVFHLEPYASPVDARLNEFNETRQLEINHQIIDIRKYENEIELQAYEYHQRNNCLPRYLKINKNMNRIWLQNLYRNESGIAYIQEYLGLIVCPTDDIDIEQVEVF